MKVLENNPDYTLRLNDIWALESINGERCLYKDDESIPMLEINMAMRRINGKAHCNGYFGSVTVKDETHIAFGRIGSTMMACPRLGEEQKMLKALNDVDTWSIDNMRLTLFDKDGNELLKFRKID